MGIVKTYCLWGKGWPGTRIPDERWDDAVAIARVEGVHEAARALRLDAGRLERRLVATMRQAEKVGGGSNQFVELAACEVSAIGQSAVELVGSDGERMRIEVGGQRRCRGARARAALDPQD